MRLWKASYGDEAEGREMLKDLTGMGMGFVHTGLLPPLGENWGMTLISLD